MKPAKPMTKTQAYARLQVIYDLLASLQEERDGLKKLTDAFEDYEYQLSQRTSAQKGLERAAEALDIARQSVELKGGKI